MDNLVFSSYALACARLYIPWLHEVHRFWVQGFARNDFLLLGQPIISFTWFQLKTQRQREKSLRARWSPVEVLGGRWKKAEKHFFKLMHEIWARAYNSTNILSHVVFHIGRWQNYVIESEHMEKKDIFNVSIFRMSHTVVITYIGLLCSMSPAVLTRHNSLCFVFT